MDRDLIGYGAHPPDPKWPGGARLAVNFVLNYEEGSEPSVPDGDPASEWGLTENGVLNPGVTGRDRYPVSPGPVGCRQRAASRVRRGDDAGGLWIGSAGGRGPSTSRPGQLRVESAAAVFCSIIA